MEYKEILAKLKELNFDAEKMGSYCQNGSYYYDREIDEEIEIDFKGILQEHFGDVKIVDTSVFHDGYECHVVFQFTEHNVWIKYTGYFSSYEGTDWRKSLEVFPEQRMVTFYNEKAKVK